MPVAAKAEKQPQSSGESLPQLSPEEKKLLENLPASTVLIKAKRILPTDETVAFAETIQVEEESSRFETVSDLLSKTTGVQVRQLGGLGSYGVASIRGSTPAQVPVYLDGVLLNAGGFASVNLSDVALDTLDSIEVYRGNTPVELSTAGIGGAIHFHTRKTKKPSTEASMSYGSFDTVRTYFLHKNRIRDETKILAIGSVTQSQGDFKYLNWNGTWLNPEDDFITRRQNNEHLSIGTLVKLNGKASEWRWTAACDLFFKNQGMPGIGSITTQHAKLLTMRDALSLHLVRVWPTGTKLSFDAGYLLLHEDMDDTALPHGELGIGGPERTQAFTHALSTGATVVLLPLDRHRSTARLELRWERYSHRQLVADLEPEPKQRLRTALSLEHRWNPLKGLFLSPQVRLEMHNNHFGGGKLPGEFDEMSRVRTNELYWQISFGTRFEVLPGLSLRLNAGRIVRTPDLSELFGSRGAVIGNWKLEPEKGFNLDAGMVFVQSGDGAITQLRLELAAFAALTQDMIVLYRHSPHTVKPKNLSSAETLGVEASCRMSLWNLLSLSANYTYLHAINTSAGYQAMKLPGRVPHEGYAKLELGRRGATWGGFVWTDVSYTGENYFFDYNQPQYKAEARTLFGAGFRVERPGENLSLTIDIKNLFNTIALSDSQSVDRPLLDFFGFPLPGRTVMITLHWHI